MSLRWLKEDARTALDAYMAHKHTTGTSCCYLPVMCEIYGTASESGFVGTFSGTPNKKQMKLDARRLKNLVSFFSCYLDVPKMNCHPVHNGIQRRGYAGRVRKADRATNHQELARDASLYMDVLSTPTRGDGQGACTAASASWQPCGTSGTSSKRSCTALARRTRPHGARTER